MSNYPGGFPGGITVRGQPLQLLHPGEVFWVNNSSVLAKSGVGGSNGNDGSYRKPFSTIDYAVGRCTASRGDVIMVMPGHAESITSATTLALDVAGVAVIGLGGATGRPTLTFTTANTATINISAANVTVKNISFVGNFLSIVSAITIGAAPSCTIEGCGFSDTSAILGFLSAIKTTVTVNADHLHILNNRIHPIATTRSTAPIVVLGAMTGLTVKDNRVTSSVSQNNVSQFISHAALVMTDLLVTHNTVYCINTDTATGAVLLSTTATTGSGIIAHNRVRARDTAAAIVVTAAAVQYGMFDNLYTGETTQLSGFVLPAIASDA